MATENEKLSLLDLGIFLEAAALPHSGFQVFLYRDEQWFELGKIKAWRAPSNFLRSPDFGAVLDGIDVGDAPQMDQRETGYRPSVVQGDGYLEIIIPARFEVYGRTQLALDADGRPIRAFKKSNYNPVLVSALVKSYRWNRQLESGQVTITDLAKQERRDRTYVSRVVNLMYLAPEIISSILTGTQPATMHLQDLTANLPIEWHRQKQLLKFPVSAN